MGWMAVYVKSRAEKKVAAQLQQQGVEVFCPLKTEIRQWSDRKKKLEVPYFPSYVFTAVQNEKSRLSILQTNGVVGFVHWLGKPAVISDAEMQEVMRFFEAYPTEQICINTFETGQLVAITTGMMKGKRGEILQHSKKYAVVAIEQLGFVLRVKVPKTAIS
ncbi:UpxY family transcription antiterminator [Mesonia sp. K7]|uniref:UpxY family transcription antiterminator n=1 Tax=Mesonia sp. K7 TaxID=2218606 RepID=UPI000DA9641F|nr:UpxY family transcription antiterminator [Mesonia sp. K7]PZD76593.1 hypothetical protein DNG35_11415 [Mesonia sp. K7]